MDRIQRLDSTIQHLSEQGVRRTTFYPLVAESLAATVGEARQLRRAKAFAHLLDSVDLVVLPDELIAGSILGMWPVANDLPGPCERRRKAVDALEACLAAKRGGSTGEVRQRRWALMARDHYDASIPYAELQALIREMTDRYAAEPDLNLADIGRELEHTFSFDYGENVRKLLVDLPWIAANHLDLNYRRAVTRGYGAIREEICSRLNDAREAGDEERSQFYQATRIAVNAAIRFIDRYAATLESEATAADEVRGSELLEMAAICRRIATGRPKTFREALQLTWLTHIMGNVGGGSALSFARFDQYLGPFYERDVALGILSREEARELVCCIWLKVNDPKMRTVQSMTLGGLTPEGLDGTNDLTKLCLDVCRDLAKPYPNVAVRLHAGSPPWLLHEVVTTMKAGAGQPMVLNDERWIANLTRFGLDLVHARDYYNMGCVEIMIHGRQPNWVGGGGVQFPAALERMLLRKEADGTLSELSTFEAFMASYQDTVRAAVEQGREGGLNTLASWKGRYYDPFASALIEGCLEQGTDMFQGGTDVKPIVALTGVGLGTATDSLAAVRKHVYQNRTLSLPDLVDVLKRDFNGAEELQTMLDRGTPCYGNDIDQVDELAKRIFTCFTDSVHDLNDADAPCRFGVVFFSYTSHVYAGETVMATPNGRREGEPLSDAIGPSQGKDTHGPTSLLRSVLKLDHGKVSGAYALNLKLVPSLLAGPDGSAALAGLIRGCFACGGAQLQVNFVDQEVLLDALEHPERHGNLVVRVAGYSEYFTSLDRHLQEEIVQRAAHGV